MKQPRMQENEMIRGLDVGAIESRRVPLERKVILKFHHFGGFFVEYSANISLTGMFIKTDSPKAPGSVFIFEIWLGDEYKLVHGLGEVVWIRNHDDGPSRPAGMGIRYLKMDEESRAVVERIVAEHVQKGGEIFDLDSVTEAETPVAIEAVPESEETSDILQLDEEELGLLPATGSEVDVGATRELRVARSRRGLSIAAALVILAAAMGGLAYLVSAGLLSF